jgi:hypothetical protein
MIRKCLAGAAISLLAASGAAFAQTVSTETTTQSTTAIPPIPVAPAPGTVNESHTQTTVDAYGRQIEKSQVYRSGNGRTESSYSTTVKEPDGSVRTQHTEQWQVAPQVQTTTTTRSITTEQ